MASQSHKIDWRSRRNSFLRYLNICLCRYWGTPGRSWASVACFLATASKQAFPSTKYKFHPLKLKVRWAGYELWGVKWWLGSNHDCRGALYAISYRMLICGYVDLTENEKDVYSVGSMRVHLTRRTTSCANFALLDTSRLVLLSWPDSLERRWRDLVHLGSRLSVSIPCPHDVPPGCLICY